MDAVCFDVEFLIYGAQSLKDKRMVTRSIKDRCKARFNVSVVECGHADKWQLGRMGFAIAAISKTEADKNMQSVIDYLDADERIEVIHIGTY